jgi:signal transduction histidine kinase
LYVRSHPQRLVASADDAQVSFDPLLLSRVLQNLIDNALKYGARRAPVTVRATVRDEALKLTVEDCGAGIPVEARARIFDPWSRLTQPGEPERIAGHGLGLAFCKQAVEAHGGRIDIEDAEPQGTRFVITLPAMKEPASGT